MRHFVAYHNSDKMGHEDSDPTGLYTRKNTSQTGDLIWIVTGSGKSPKRYSLTSWFIVSHVEPADNSRFRLTVRGTEGGALNPTPILNDLPWFAGFFRRMAHFSLGLQEITDPIVIRSMRRLAASGSRPLPNSAGSTQTAVLPKAVRAVAKKSADDDLQEVQLAAIEGSCHRAEALFRSRNRKLIEAKKRQSQGKCTICEFDFKATFRGLERDLLVAHHIKPIGKRKKPARTTLNEIDVLCPNCHAAVHSQDPPLSADQLRQRLVS